MIRVSVRVPNTRRIPNFNEVLRLAIRDTGKELNKLFNKTTTTWRHDVPFRTKYQGNNKVTVSTDDKPYFFVNGGTRVRRALMSPDFVPKSQPRTLRQQAGRGGVVFISRNVNRPGIKARKFDEQIAELIEPKMVRFLQQRIRSAR